MAEKIRQHVDHAQNENTRPCARGARCADRATDGTPARGPRALCETDRRYAKTVLEHLPNVYGNLRDELGFKRSGGPNMGGTRGTSVYAPAPMRLDLDDLVWSIEMVLYAWTRVTRAAAGLPPAGRDDRQHRWGSNAAFVLWSCQVLGAHLDTFINLPSTEMTRATTRHTAQKGSRRYGDAIVVADHPIAGYLEIKVMLTGADGTIELMDLHRQARQRLGYTPQHERLPVPCDNCDLLELVRWDGAAGVEDGAYCLSCGYEYSDNEFTLLRARVYEVVSKTR